VQWNGGSAPALTPAFTDDGGHLNAAGRLRAARELVSVLAGLPR
jgi:lysophospholipase L1-like esterase